MTVRFSKAALFLTAFVLAVLSAVVYVLLVRFGVQQFNSNPFLFPLIFLLPAVLMFLAACADVAKHRELWSIVLLWVGGVVNLLTLAFTFPGFLYVFQAGESIIPLLIALEFMFTILVLALSVLHALDRRPAA